MRSGQLFRSRLLSDFQFQRKVIGTVMDWVIALYLFIPAILIIPLFYLDIWKNPTAYWFEGIPLPFLISVLLLFTLFNQIRTFSMEADILFLLQMKVLYEGLRKWAFGFTLLQISFMKGILLLALFPILIQIYQFRWQEFIFLACFLIAFELFISLIKKVFTRPVLVWLGVIIPLYIGAVALAGNLSVIQLGWLGILLFVILCIWYWFKLIPSKHYFFEEAAFEGKHRLRYAKFIISFSTGVEKPPLRIWKRPLFLRRGQRIFNEQSPENGLLEIVLKGFIRHSVYFNSYFRFITVTLFAISILPIWMKWIVFTLFVIFLQYNSWLKGLYEKLLDEDFFQVAPFAESLKQSVWPRFKRILFVPAILLIGAWTVMMTILFTL